jgi:hypothetical protein
MLSYYGAESEGGSSERRLVPLSSRPRLRIEPSREPRSQSMAGLTTLEYAAHR